MAPGPTSRPTFHAYLRSATRRSSPSDRARLEATQQLDDIESPRPRLIGCGHRRLSFALLPPPGRLSADDSRAGLDPVVVGGVWSIARHRLNRRYAHYPTGLAPDDRSRQSTAGPAGGDAGRQHHPRAACPKVTRRPSP
ncbi:hypothetical protein HBB16_07425 [Pseudonocardia sp. MCCB 268]|nr:hypothetical protein [Pseudonocardia cytotoxica]